MLLYLLADMIELRLMSMLMKLMALKPNVDAIVDDGDDFEYVAAAVAAAAAQDVSEIPSSSYLSL